MDWPAIRRAMAEEWPMVTGPLPAIVVVALGAAGVIDERNSIRFALWIGVVQLLGWGIAFARRQQWNWPAALTAGAVNAVFGAAIVAVEVAIH
jgi:hypothetical protein